MWNEGLLNDSPYFTEITQYQVRISTFSENYKILSNSVNSHQLFEFTLKGDDKKTLHLKFCFAHISAANHRIFKILVPTPHNIPLIMGGTHKNFKDRMYRS